MSFGIYHRRLFLRNSLRAQDLVTLRPERDGGHKGGTLPELAPDGMPEYPDLGRSRKL